MTQTRDSSSTSSTDSSNLDDPANVLPRRRAIFAWFSSFLAPPSRTGFETEETAPPKPGTSEQRPLRIVVFLLISLLILYLVVLLGSARQGTTVLTLFLASCAVGGLIGFIFAIPKRTDVAIVRTNNGEGSDAARGSTDQMSSAVLSNAYRPNTSLEEISDWLTKIIVGLGLVQAQQIGRFINDQGGAMAPVLFGSDAPAIAGSASLVATAVLSFLASFLYFRMYLAAEFTRSDLDPIKAQDEFEQARVKGRTQQLGPKSAMEAIANSPTPPAGTGSCESGPAGAAPVDDRMTGSTVLQGADAEPGTASRGELQGIGQDTGPVSFSEAIARKLSAMQRRPLDKSDPSKGLFGSRSVVTEPGVRMLTAKVTEDKTKKGWFRIRLRLASGDPKLQGEVAFFYHPTFSVNHERVLVTRGEANVRLYAYGAFTVGVLADEGRTELELDLATLEDAPQEFREN